MPPFSDIFTVDTLRTGPASEAFREGTLLFPTSEPTGLPEALQWGDYAINWIPSVVSALLLVIFAGRIVELLPYLLGGLGRWKVSVNLEDSVGRTRDRNNVFAASILPLCMVLSRYRICVPSFLLGMAPPYHTLGVVGAVLSALLLRRLIIAITGSINPRLRDDYAQISHRCLRNFIILGALTSVTVSTVLAAVGLSDSLIRAINIYLLLFYALIFLIRRTQILSNSCNQFQAILYLCALEIPPLGLLVLLSVFH